MGFCCLLNIVVVIVAIGGIVGSRGHLHTLCLPQARRLRTCNKAGGDACAPGHIAGDTPAYTGQALLILCSWVAHSLLLFYFFSTSSQLLYYSFSTSSSLLHHYSFTTLSLLLHYFFTFFTCSCSALWCGSR